MTLFPVISYKTSLYEGRSIQKIIAKFYYIKEKSSDVHLLNIHLCTKMKNAIARVLLQMSHSLHNGIVWMSGAVES